MSDEIKDMIENPSKYGFAWGLGKLHNGQGDKAVVVCESAPFILHRDLDLIRQTFGDQYVMDSMNGQSNKVRDQGVVRTACEKNIKLRSDLLTLKRMVLERALGHRRRGGVTVVETIVEKFTAIDGTTWPTQAEAMAHSIDVMQAKQQQ